MKLEVYDPPMCCSTGVCGPEVDPVLVAFAADLHWIGEQGIEVHRYNLGTNPQAFIENPVIATEIKASVERLPIIAIDGQIISTGIYPTRDQMAAKLGLSTTAKETGKTGGSCCSGSSCC